MIEFADVQDLIRSVGFPRVSLYMPTHRTGTGVRQDPIRFKNQLREVARGLEEQGLRSDQIDSLVDDLRTRIDDEDFWQRQDLGLAAFLEPGRTRVLHLPREFNEETHVGLRYHVKPLLPLLMRDGLFYVLSMRHDEVKLYAATRYGMREIEDERIPPSSAPVVDLNRRAARTLDSDAKGDVPEAPVAADEKDRLLQQREMVDFTTRVGVGVSDVLSGQHAPLVVAADDKLLGQVRQHLKYPYLIEDAIRTHPAALGPQGLHEKAYELVRDMLDEGRRSAIERVEARLNDPDDQRASNRVEDIVPAAAFSRVDTLVVAPDETVLGRFDADAMSVTLGESEDAVDLVDYAVAETLAHGGAVYTLPAGAEAPRVAALFRY